MILELIELFKDNLTPNQIENTPILFVDIQSISQIHVNRNIEANTCFMSYNNNGLEFKTAKAAIAAARLLADRVSESREYTRIENANTIKASMAQLYEDIK